jgi:predicted alpha/beta superfamily hydrolase
LDDSADSPGLQAVLEMEPEPPPEREAEPELATVQEIVAAQLDPERRGEVQILGPFRVPELPGLPGRRLRVYLPKRYSAAQVHPVLYLFDGQNVFGDAPSFAGGWHTHEVVERLSRGSCPLRRTPVVVALDHSGQGRISELSPFRVEGRPGWLDLLLAWMVDDLVPSLAARLRIATGPFDGALEDGLDGARTVIGGSSMGGLAALYAHFSHPEAFGGALVMSPALWVGDQAIFREIAERPSPLVSRLYLDGGTREGRGTLLPLVQRLAFQLTARGWTAENLLWRTDPRGLHDEASWRRRLPRALRFLFQHELRSTSPGDLS